ncbi:hypothetical protein BH11CYA1_BH11CYA1_32580 [soil metagenome]
MKLAEQPFLILDCQTTGATPQSAQILELGWYLAHSIEAKLKLPGNLQPQIKSRLLKQPDDQEVPMRIQRITGISTAHMQEAHAPSAVVSELLDDLNQKQVRFAIAHYAQFEQAFVNQLFADHRPEQNLPFDFICTCQIAKRLYPDLPSRAIRALGGYFGFSLTEMKRSTCHVEATYFIWQRLVADLAAIGILEDEQLVDWLRQPIAKAAVKAKKNPYAIPMERLKRLDLPNSPGVYRMLSSDGRILYVGKATSLKSRVNSYFRGRKGKDSKTKELISQIFDIAVEVVATPLEAALLETDLIKQYDPPYNRALRQRGRVLKFFSHDFSQVSLQQDSVHSIGPFVSEGITPLIDFLQALQSEAYPVELFWGLASPELIAKAFALVLADGPLATNRVEQLSVRRLMAIGMTMVRQEVNCLRAERREQTRLKAAADFEVDSAVEDCLTDGPNEDSSDESGEELGDELDEEPREIDENDLVEMIYGILARSAKLHLQAKRLTCLLNSRITFCDAKVRRTLTFINGQLVASEAAAESNLCSNSPELALALTVTQRHDPAWLNLEIDAYDRMRVLLTELARVTLKDNGVTIFEMK